LFMRSPWGEGEGVASVAAWAASAIVAGLAVRRE
jgi:hypothetical protein